MKTITIHVTQEDIDKGQVGTRLCPIARALSRECSDANDVVVGVEHALISLRGGGYRRLALGKRASGFIYSFDHHDRVVPTTFRLRVLV